MYDNCQKFFLNICIICSVNVFPLEEADLYSAFIEVPYTQGAQVRIT